MIKRLVLLFVVMGLLLSIVSAQETIGEPKSSPNMFLYVSIFSIIVIIGLVIFFIKKLNFNLRRVLKSVIVSLLITMIIEVLFFIIGFFLGLFIFYCNMKLGGHCPSQFEVFLENLPYTAIPIFLITILIYYVIKFVKRKKF